MLYLHESCPACLGGQGRLTALCAEGGTAVIFCDEQDHTWMDPFDIGESTMLIPDPSGALGNGVVLQNTRWARRADLPPAWKALTWQGWEE